MLVFITCYFYCNCCYYQTGYWLKKECALPYQHKMNNVKEIKAKNRANYFFDETINIKHFDTNKMKTDEKS